MIVGNESTSPQRIDFMELDDFVFTRSQQVRMEVLNAENGVFMASYEWDKLHGMPVEDLGIATVRNYNDKVALVFLLSAWFRILYVDNFIVKTDDSIKSF